jgi:hypothetical protein
MGGKTMAKKLSDTVVGGIYEYYRTDNDEVVYRGSSEKDLDGLNNFHREGHSYSVFKNNPSWRYSYTVFRSNLRRPLGEKLKCRWVVEPIEMTRHELLSLEGVKIREMIDTGQCYLNHDPDPLKSFKKYNG